MNERLKPRLSLSYGKLLPVEEVANSVQGVGSGAIQQLFESKLHEHYRRFGHQPYSLVYDRRRRGYVLQAGPVIGLIDFDYFELFIQPKFPELEIGKCLHLAHRCQVNSLVKHTNRLVEKELLNINALSSVDYFATTFLSSVIDLINNGLLRKADFKEGPDPDFRGTLLIDKHIAFGGNPLEPYTRRPTTINDIPINRTIKEALKLCRLHCDNPQVQSLASATLNYFQDVSDQSPNEAFVYEFESSLYREEYKRAVTIAQMIIEGFDPFTGSEDSFFPSFTLDLDQLFEKFISFELSLKLRKELYKVLVQPEYNHATIPEFDGKYIKPDIVVENINSSERIILDTKNKYSLLNENTVLSVSNSDLYQIAYYCFSLKTRKAILVYPSNKKNTTRYPFRGSEGEVAYEQKRDRAVKCIKSDSASFIKIDFSEHPIELFFWRINLEGKMFETIESVSQLALFIADALKGRIE